MTPVQLTRLDSNADRLPRESELQSWNELRRILREPLLLPEPVDLHLVRHGETETNALSLVTGAQDVALTPKGRTQAREIGKHLASYYDLAFYSPLSRSRETLWLALEAGHARAGRVISDWRLSERSLGCLELQPWQPVEEYAQGNLNYAPEGGDSYAEVARRVLSFLLDLRQLLVEIGHGKVLLCSHMGPMRILTGIIEEQGCPEEVLAKSFGNTEVVRLRWHRLVMPEFLKEARELSACTKGR